MKAEHSSENSATLRGMSHEFDDPTLLSRRAVLQVTAASSLLPSTALAAATETKATTTTVAQYIASRVAEVGEHILLFGVPGATCEPLYTAFGDKVRVTSSDSEAAAAADGFARVAGLGVVAVTYSVGTLSLAPVIAGANVERSPVLVVNGGPTAEDLRLQRELGTLFTHSNGKEKTDLTVFKEVTAFAERIERAADAPRLVDAALTAALTQSRPVYLEVAKDLWSASCPAPTSKLALDERMTGNEATVAATILERLQSAQRPVVLVGIEVARTKSGPLVTEWLQRLGVPWASTLLAKSVVAEQTPGFVGVYAGEHSMPSVKLALEKADAILSLGCVFGRQFRNLVVASRKTLMHVGDGTVRLGDRPPTPASFRRVLAELAEKPWPSKAVSFDGLRPAGLSFDERRFSLSKKEAAPSDEPGLTYDQVVRAVSDRLDGEHLVITDTSLSMYPAAELNVTGPQGFVCNAVWQSIGFSLAAATGVALGQSRRVVVVCGDGGFQMTAQSLATLAAHVKSAIVVVLDNACYGIEQWLLEPKYFADVSAKAKPYLNLRRWNYVDFAKSLGVPNAVRAETVASLSAALDQAKQSKGLTLISANMQRHDLPSELKVSRGP